MSLKRTIEVKRILSKLEDVKNFPTEKIGDKTRTLEGRSDKYQEGDKADEDRDNISTLEDLLSDAENLNDKFENAYENED